MWADKLIDGVLELDTPIGSRYIRPDVWQSALLMWIFRNFQSLPQRVLRPWQRRLIDRLRATNEFVGLSVPGSPDRPIIGHVELRPERDAKVVPLHEANPTTPQPVRERGQEAASA